MAINAARCRRSWMKYPVRAVARQAAKPKKITVQDIRYSVQNMTGFDHGALR